MSAPIDSAGLAEVLTCPGAATLSATASSTFATPARKPARPGGPPTRDRKLKATTFAQVDAARALTKPQPLPERKARRPKPNGEAAGNGGGDKIVFQPDDTPADAEQRIAPVKKKPGPVPKSAPAAQHHAQQQIRAARAAIAPSHSAAERVGDNGSDQNHSNTDAAAGPILSDEEMNQVVRLVQDKYGPILNIEEQAAEVSKFAKQTLRERVSLGQYADSVVRGRPLRFWTIGS